MGGSKERKRERRKRYVEFGMLVGAGGVSVCVREGGGEECATKNM